MSNVSYAYAVRSGEYALFAIPSLLIRGNVSLTIIFDFWIDIKPNVKNASEFSGFDSELGLK